jgi:hypothetical protein
MNPTLRSGPALVWQTSPAIAEPITPAEASDLIRLEDTIKRGLETFVEVGNALAEIRDRKLYRTEHATFADYCKAKWSISDRRARQLMDAAEVVAEVSKSGTIVPKTESQARPLTRLKPGQRAAAWKAAVASSPINRPTAKQVDAVVNKRTFKQPEETKTPLQWLTHWWPLTSEEDRRLFDNFRAGVSGGFSTPSRQGCDDPQKEGA